MYEELIRRLREEPLDSNKAALPIMDLCIDAATAIENLSHRLDMAQAERDAVTRHMIELEQDVCRLKSRLAAYENTGLEPEDLKKAFNETAILKLSAQALSTTPDHLRDLIQAEQDGRLVVLPCKVGATVYGHSKAEVSEYKVAVISLATYNWYLRCQNHNSDFWVTDADIGESIFLTREEAEAALAQEGASDGKENT